MRTPIAAAVAALFVSVPVFADDATLSEVVVAGGGEAPLTQPDPQPWARSQVSREGIAVLGGPAQTNPYRLVDLMPSVNAESADTYGMSVRGGRNLSLRGKGDFHLTRNIEGVPLYGLVGNNDLFDLENVASFDLYRGALPANAGLGVSNTTGAMNLGLRRPEEKLGVDVQQSFGSDNFRRTFARVDSGRFGPGNTSFFVSSSDTEADKWKGAGQAPGSRKNVTFGLAQPFSNGASFELFVASNHIEGNDYRAMSYAETLNKNNWRHLDYDKALSSVAAQRSNWHDYNRNEFDDVAVIANLTVPVGEAGKFTFRPYWWDNDGYYLFKNNANVRRWDVEHQQKGFVAQYDHKFSSALELTLGYWWMNMESPPPPVYQKNFTTTASGGLNFANWALLSKHGEHEFRSPFLQLTGRTGATTISGGVRLHQQLQPSFSYYSTAGLPNVSYDAVWGYSPAIDPWQQVSGKTFRELLPNLSLRHELRSDLALTAAYSRRLGRADWGPVASTYNSNRAAFVAQGISLQQVFDGLKPEISDNFDLGLRYEGERLLLAPTLYYAKSRDKEVSTYDPLVNVSYYQSVAKAIAIGAELEGSYRFGGGLSAIFALSYNKFSFDGDVQAKSGAATATDGKQVPNAARVLAKFGLDWRSGGWNVSPVARYVGKRYGDTLNTQKVDAYFLADLHLGYKWRNVSVLQELGVGLSVLNLFDKNYIGQISASNFDLNAGTTYYAGAPRTAVMTVSAKF